MAQNLVKPIKSNYSTHFKTVSTTVTPISL